MLDYKWKVEPVQAVRAHSSGGGVYKGTAQGQLGARMSGAQDGPEPAEAAPEVGQPGAGGALDARELAALLGVSTACVHKWGRDGKACRERLDPRTGKWHYLVLETCGRGTPMQALRGMADATKGPHGVIYARVSSPNEQALLRGQIKELKGKYPDHRVFSDTGSGMDNGRLQFDRMLQLCLSGEVSEVCVTTSDRLCFMSYDLVAGLLRRAGVQVRVERRGSSFTESELKSDMMAVTDRINRHFQSARATSRKGSGGPGKPKDGSPMETS